MWLIRFARLGLGFLLIALGGHIAAAPVILAWAPPPQVEYIGRLALDAAGNGWAWGLTGTDVTTHLLLRIQNGGWRVVADGATQPALLPARLDVTRMAITADGRDGWAIATVGYNPYEGESGYPLLWHLYNGTWHVDRTSIAPSLLLDDLTLSADGRNGWLRVWKPYTGPGRLLSLRNGQWDFGIMPGSSRLGLAAISPDGRQGWALRYEYPTEDYTILRWRGDRWVPVYRHFRPTEVPEELMVDNAAHAWLTTGMVSDEKFGPDELIHFSDSTPPQEIPLGGTILAPGANPDVVTDVWLHGLTLAGTGVGWATGERVVYPQNGEGTTTPFLLQLQGDTATLVDVAQVGLPAVAHLGQVAISPQGSYSWVAWEDSTEATHLDAIQMPTR